MVIRLTVHHPIDGYKKIAHTEDINIDMLDIDGEKTIGKRVRELFVKYGSAAKITTTIVDD